MSDKICCATSPCDRYVTFNIPEILGIYTAILCFSWVLKKLSIFQKLVIHWTTASVRFCFVRTDRICSGLVEHTKLPVWMTDWIFLFLETLHIYTQNHSFLDVIASISHQSAFSKVRSSFERRPLVENVPALFLKPLLKTPFHNCSRYSPVVTCKCITKPGRNVVC